MKAITYPNTLENQNLEEKKLTWSSKKTSQWLQSRKFEPAIRSKKPKLRKLNLIKIAIISFLLIGIIAGIIFIDQETKSLFKQISAQSLVQKSEAASGPESVNLHNYFKKVAGIMETSSQIVSQNNIYDSSTKEMKTEVEKILGPDKANFAVYFKDLKTGQEFDVDGAKLMPPASTSKVPYAILTLKEAQDGKRSLKDGLLLQENLKYISEDAMFNYQSDLEYPISEYLRNLITNSDNTAMMHLESLHGGAATYNQKLAQMGIKLTRSPHITTAIDVGAVFEGIYKQKWLNQTNTDYLLDLLKVQTNRNSDRLVLAMQKFPESKVAHKIGQLDTDNGVSYLDAGIIYGPKTDFVIVILNQDTTYIKATTKIHQISQYLYKKLNT